MLQTMNYKKWGLPLLAGSLMLALLLTGCSRNTENAAAQSENRTAGQTTAETRSVESVPDATGPTQETAQPVSTQDSAMQPDSAEKKADGSAASTATVKPETQRTAAHTASTTNSATAKRTTASVKTTRQSTVRTTATTRQSVVTTRRTTSVSASATAPSASQPADNSTTAYQAEVLRLVNKERQKAGVSPLTADSGLNQVALLRAEETIVKFDHVRPDGSKFYTALQQAGIPYRATGENIAMGQRTPAEVMDGWMNSSGHRQNILNASYGKLGVGYVVDPNGRAYWVQIFTN